MTSLRAQILRLIQLLRGRGVRISTAETIDALNAIATAGFARVAMREALAAALIKDESDRPAFDDVYAAFFRAPGAEPGPVRDATSRDRMDGRGRGGEATPDSASRPEPEPREAPAGSSQRQERQSEEPKREPSEREEHGDQEAATDEAHDAGAAQESREAQGLPRDDDRTQAGIDAQRHARLRAAEHKPFAQYSDLDYELAREALAPLARRFRVRIGRRLKLARRGRIDFRRTLRASTQRGGALLELRFRSRRPRHIDLLILADISGSVRYSSTLMLELIAGARRCFRRVTSFVYVDRMAEAEFEQRHLVMTPALDLYARSDFGRVLAELWNRREELLGRAVILVIMGDARNNRRPARADLLREIARRCRAVIWLNPEESHRWGTGDSAIRSYEREVKVLLPARNLRELEAGLVRLS
jgi:uncharacterized protein with von Willebrand factor type A (vWA) domain